MKKYKPTIKIYSLLAISFIAIIIPGCSKVLEIDPPKSKIATKTVFESEATASSATVGMYINMLSSSTFARGGVQSITGLAGLSADEFTVYPPNQPDYKTFEENVINPNNPNNQLLWETAYKSIYDANSVYEGLVASTAPITENVKKQLMGEALFVRAFCHFNLVNLFGEVPVVTSTDYIENSSVKRQDINLVYDQIIEDLLMARDLLMENYLSSSRGRPNKFAATALLARTYLYRGDWENAKKYSDELLSHTELYQLLSLDQVFLMNSKEAIWQLQSIFSTVNSNDGYDFIIEPAVGPEVYVLSESLIDDFEPGDQRRNQWIGEFNTGTETIYFPFKYKIKSSSSITEASTVFRLAEQYLINAEAKAQLDDLPGAIVSLDSVRNRAGLDLISDISPGISKNDLLLSIEQERRIELFTEWGHRWYDLKRTGRADAILDPIKASWTENAKVYPIPQSELNKNQKLGDQNDGY